MKKQDFRRVSAFHIIILLMILLSLVKSLPGQMEWEELKKSTDWVMNTPFAVRYKIIDLNTFMEQMRRAYPNIEGSMKITGKTGFAYLSGECLYVSDGKGRERFQFTRIIEPLDSVRYPELHDERTISMTRLPGKTLIRYREKSGVWERKSYFEKEEYFFRTTESAFRFPFFGLAIYRIHGKRYGTIIALPELIDHARSNSESTITSDTLVFKLDKRTIIIEQTHDPSGFVIREESIINAQKIESVRTNLESTVTPEGYLYPEKARIIKIGDGSPLRQTWITIEEILIGPKGLEKYPLFPPGGWRP